MSQNADETPAKETTTGENGTGPDPLKPFQQQIEELIDAISRIVDDIASAKSSVDKANQELEKKRAREKELTSRKTTLQRLLDGFTTDHKKVTQQRESANAAVGDARTQLKNIRGSLQEQLSEDQRNTIDAAIEDIDSKIDALEESHTDKKKELDEAEQALAQARAATAHAEVELRNAQNELRALPGSLQKWSADVKKVQNSLETEHKRGNLSQAYLVAADLDEALKTLEGYANPALEQQLTSKIHDAWTRNKDARDKLPSAEARATTFQQELKQISDQLEDYRNNRRKKIDEVLAASSTAAETSGSTTESESGVSEKPAGVEG